MLPRYRSEYRSYWNNVVFRYAVLFGIFIHSLFAVLKEDHYFYLYSSPWPVWFREYISNGYYLIYFVLFFMAVYGFLFSWLLVQKLSLKKRKGVRVEPLVYGGLVVFIYCITGCYIIIVR